MTRAATAGRATLDTPARRSAGSDSAGYLKTSERPLPALVFLLPLLILYEVGTRYLTYDQFTGTEQRIVAFNLIQHFFGWFHATGRYLPAMTVVGVLLAWHIARNDPWRVSGMTTLAMLLESSLLAVPLLAISAVVSRYLPLAAQPRSTELAITSIGAGVYEELVFRLIGMTLLHLIFADWLKLSPKKSALLMVGISAVAFSLYHYLGFEHFTWRSFVFRTIAGIYFGVIFLLRGFGVTAGSHAAYDVFAVMWRVLGSS